MEQNTGMINKKVSGIKVIKTLLMSVLCLFVMFAVTACSGGGTSDDMAMDMPNTEQSDAEGVQPDESAPGAVGQVVDIDADKEQGSDKMVAVSMENVGRANPFVPASELVIKRVSKTDELPKFDLIEPPTGSDTDSDAAKVVTTKISGIMFDKYNPSAIINIENTDYLVRSGDVINGYKILAISPQTVTVQLGSNVYKAGVGELVSKDEGLVHNNVPNLANKFGGAKK